MLPRRPFRAPRAAAATAALCLVFFAVPGVAYADPDADPGANPASSDVVGGPLLGEPGVVVDASPAVPPLPAITATSFVVADADTGEVLAAQDAHAKLAPASTLKTLTAITLLPRLPANRVSIAQDDAPRVDGTKAGIVKGGSYAVRDLFTAMLMMSANDAAVALADVNGGLPLTLQQMNAEAAHLQAYDTVAKTPNGLDAPGQSSSAYDLALIFRAGLANADFRHYLALPRAPFPAPDGKTFQIQTHDKLLLSYPGMVGGKNGYTVAAQASYVGAATRDGHTIIVAVMRDQPNFWNEVKGLLDWGFAADGVASPVGELVGPAQPTPSPKPGTEAGSGTGQGAGQDAAHGAGTDASGAVSGAGGLGINRPADSAATGVSAAKATTHASGPSAGAIAAWAAVGAGALIFMLALIRTASRRRVSAETDSGYLAGLSRLSTLDRISDGP